MSYGYSDGGTHSRCHPFWRMAAISAALVMLAALCALQAHTVHAQLEFVAEFGDTGTGAGQLGEPIDVVLDRDGGDIYVVERDNNRVSIFRNNHDFEKMFGSEGSADGEFSGPLSIAKGDRDYFVLDKQNRRVQQVDDDGDFVAKFGSTNPSSQSYLNSPAGIAAYDPYKLLYVVDPGDDRLLVFTEQGKLKHEIGRFGTSTFSNPATVAVDVSGGYLYVADSGGDRILAFKLLDERQPCPVGAAEAAPGVCYVEAFGVAGSADGQFRNLAGMAIDATKSGARGDLYVADADNNRIQVLRFVESDCPDGTERISEGVCFVGKFGSFGTGDGEFDNPQGMAIDATNRLLYVADSGNDRVQVIRIDAQADPRQQQQQSSQTTKPNPPRSPEAVPASPTSILVRWSEPAQRGDLPLAITGYMVEYKSKAVGSSSSATEYRPVTSETSTNATSLLHTNLDPNTEYTYRVSAISGSGTEPGDPSIGKSARPAATDTPIIVEAVALSPTRVKLTWLPPSDTLQLPINGYIVEKALAPSVDQEIGIFSPSVDSLIHEVEVDDENKFHVIAMIGSVATPPSEPVKITARDDSYHTGVIEPEVVELVRMGVPSPPIKVQAEPVSDTQIDVTWRQSADDGNLKVTGYTIEAKKRGASDFSVVAKGLSGSKYSHVGLEPNSEYTYRMYATNSMGDSGASNESTAAARIAGLRINPVGSLVVDEGRPVAFIVTLSGDAAPGATFSLDGQPEGASIAASTGAFSWTPSSDQGGRSHSFAVVATQGAHTDSAPVRISVNDVLDDLQQRPPQQQQRPPQQQQQQPVQQDAPPDTTASLLASFVDASVNPQEYVDRYNTDEAFREWFDANYAAQYATIYKAVGLPDIPAPFVDPAVDPQEYVDRYNAEESFREWFDTSYPEYGSIYHAVGLPDPSAMQEEPMPEIQYGICGQGTRLIEGVCTIVVG